LLGILSDVRIWLDRNKVIVNLIGAVGTIASTMRRCGDAAVGAAHGQLLRGQQWDQPLPTARRSVLGSLVSYLDATNISNTA
jgi:hypothetical protein